ncbi:hypothetical protein H7J86_26325 [Mycobacterium hackensackense]|uniref:hypothetical protein n=1 Tax=Mycobacterium hackensackense TaxID=228909 RepID=UPI002265EC26|nr:hypothetical protein [Mycobacterium hackensackense]MCV7255686.1 hypothetical protein [Mycobacterium hackensackense]
MTPLEWVDDDGWLVARDGAVTYFIASSWKVLPTAEKFDVLLTHAEMERGDDGEPVLLYRGWGHDVDDAKRLVELIRNAPVGDDSARLEWMRQHQRELAAEVAR